MGEISILSPEIYPWHFFMSSFIIGHTNFIYSSVEFFDINSSNSEDLSIQLQYGIGRNELYSLF